MNCFTPASHNISQEEYYLVSPPCHCLSKLPFRHADKLCHIIELSGKCFCFPLILSSNIWAWSGIPDLAKLVSCHSFDFLPFGIGYSRALILFLNEIVLLASFDVQWLLNITSWVTPTRSLEKPQPFSHKCFCHTKLSAFTILYLFTFIKPFSNIPKAVILTNSLFWS